MYISRLIWWTRCQFMISALDIHPFNPWPAELIVGNIRIYMYLHFLSFPPNFRWDQYSQVPLQRGGICQDITYESAITVAGSESDFRITTDTPYLTFMGELGGVNCEDLGENWLHYNSGVLYLKTIFKRDKNLSLLQGSFCVCAQPMRDNVTL